MSEDLFWTHFHEIFESIPRQGPGERASTLRALGMLPRLTANQRILDIGCGAGLQTLDLASSTEARIVALDVHPPFLAILDHNVRAKSLGDRVITQLGDMNDLPFGDQSFDVVWSEGAIFIMGFSKGLAAWRRLLVPGGYLVLSEFCWPRSDPPAEVREMFMDGDADVGSVDDRRRAIAQEGYRLLGDFELPAAAWWDSYYVPLAKALDRFRDAHAGDPEALDVAARSQREIDAYRRYPEHFGYVFFVMQKV